jgi:hypothetical protein
MKKRRTLDEKGLPIVEVRNRDGIYEPEYDSAAVHRLKADELSIDLTAKHRRVPGSNPYGDSNVADAKKLRKRSGLDYLRTLSAEIKKRKTDE